MGEFVIHFRMCQEKSVSSVIHGPEHRIYPGRFTIEVFVSIKYTDYYNRKTLGNYLTIRGKTGKVIILRSDYGTHKQQYRGRNQRS